MPSVNKATVLGNIGQDLELRFTETKKPVCNFRVATNEAWTGADGKRQERTEWHSIVVWGKNAENCAKYLHKGSPVYIEGSLQTRKWQDSDKNDRWVTEIIADSVQFLGTPTKDAPPTPPLPTEEPTSS